MICGDKRITSARTMNGQETARQVKREDVGQKFDQGGHMDRRSKFIEIILGLLFFYVLAIVIYAIVLQQNIVSGSERGQFGDMFGAFNAFFAGLAFMGVVVTLWKQHYIQVENTFFNMLSILQQIVSSTSFTIQNATGPDIVYSGREYFKFSFETFENFYRGKLYHLKQDIFLNDETRQAKAKLPHLVELTSEECTGPLILTYEEFYKEHDYNLGHYFRYLFNIMKYIKDSFSEDTAAQNKYIGLLQAQLSNDEMGLLFYNALSKHGKNSEGLDLFRQWLDEHEFFQNIDRRCLFHSTFINYYPKTRFKFLING